MKRFLILLAFFLLTGTLVRAQEFRSDSLRTSQVDSTLIGRNILNVIGNGVTVNQSPAMRNAFDRYVSNNASKRMAGYRIRVFFDNGQNARNRSEAIARSIASSKGYTIDPVPFCLKQAPDIDIRQISAFYSF